MSAMPGKLQSAFNAGELSELLFERELKYNGTGARFMANVQVLPQGGFRVRDGLRDVGSVNAAAARLMPFDASDGNSYDIVFSPALGAVWNATAQADTVAVSGLTSDMLPHMTSAQLLDTMLLFHKDLKPKRIRVVAPTDWQIDDAPLRNIPDYDYGGTYSNGVAATWQIAFSGLVSAGTTFALTVSGYQTTSIVYNSDMTVLAPLVKAAIEALPNVEVGVTVVSNSGGSAGDTLNISFTGTGNEGDGWAVAGRVIDKPDAAITSVKTRVGVLPGEPVISASKGWPACGVFYTQRLLVGGLKSLANAWLMSQLGDYYNLDDQLTEANGAALIPMDVAGGESIERIVAARNLLIFTSKAEYWLAERALSKTSAPNHVQSSRNGTRRGVPIVENEGAAIYAHQNGDALGEFRYTDVEGNFVSSDISLLAPHLITGVRDQAVRRAGDATSGNLLAAVLDSGEARLATILREQEITAFGRLTSSEGVFKACSVNGRNEMSFLVQRPDARRLERFEQGLLLDGAISFAYGPATATVTGLSRFNGKSVWIIGDGDVFGPFTISGGQQVLPRAVASATVGYWSAPRVDTLPLSRLVADNVVLKRRARIHSVTLELVDTTSVAIGVNGGKNYDIDLMRYGMTADVAELAAGYTGKAKLSGFPGWKDDPYVTITQNRPGRLTVRSITIEAKA